MTNHRSCFRRFFKVEVSLKGLLSTAGVLLCLFTVLGFVSDAAWFLDPFAHFRVQYLALLVALALFSLIVEKKGSFLAFLVYVVFASINAVMLLPLYTGGPPAPGDGQEVLRAMLINVNIRNRNYEAADACIRRYDPDFLVLEEIDSEWLDALSCLKERYPFKEDRSRTDSFGIALFSKYPMTSSDTVRVCPRSLPSVIGRFEFDGVPFTLFGTHPLPPWGGEFTVLRNDQLAAIPACLEKEARPLMLLGDLNVTPWSRRFQDLLDGADLRDTSLGFGFQPTWPAGFFPLWIPLDHCLASRGLVPLCREVGPNIGSDHYPLIVDFLLTLPGNG